MAQITFKDGDEYLEKLAKLDYRLADDVIGRAVYEGAKIVTDEIAERTQNVKTDESWGSPGNLKKGPKKTELQAVKKGLGIALARNDDGFINVKIGFNGYDKIPTKRWPRGRPVAMLARSIDRGTSFMQANPFVKKAVAAAKAKAVEKMKETVDEEIEKIMKG